MQIGWHNILGIDCFVLDNNVIRVRYNSGEMKMMKHDKTGWKDCNKISVSAFRRGINKGNIELW